MSQYLVLSHIQVQNANSIAGLTWGFPAITNFLGFTHALNRTLSKQYGSDYNIDLAGCAVISNKIQQKVYQPKQYADFEFLQSKNPPVLAKHKNSSPPIIEEGKMNMTVSLVIKITEPLLLTNDQQQQLEIHINETCCQMRLAGGTILKIKGVKLLSGDTEEEKNKLLNQIKRLTMPGFVLQDKSHYLQEYYETLKEIDPSVQLLDAWLDFSALKCKAIPKLEEGQEIPDENTSADWEYQPKPKDGYLVPLMTGYKAISGSDKPYDPGVVSSTRDNKTPTQFVEAIHSIGKWKGAHSIKSIDDVMWRYQSDEQWYLCTQDRVKEKFLMEEYEVKDQSNTSDLLDALNLI